MSMAHTVEYCFELIQAKLKEGGYEENRAHITYGSDFGVDPWFVSVYADSHHVFSFGKSLDSAMAVVNEKIAALPRPWTVEQIGRTLGILETGGTEL